MSGTATKSTDSGRGRPKYQQIYNRIAADIRDGNLAPGDRLPMEDELVARYDASRNTIIRALVALRDEGLLERVQGVGTFVTSTVSHRKTYGFVADGQFTVDSKDTVFAQLEFQLEQRLRDRESDLILQSRHLKGDAAGHRTKTVEHLLRENVAGVFYHPMEGDAGPETDGQLLARLRDAGIPVVLLDTDVASPTTRGVFDVVGLDNFTAGYLLAKHVYEAGARSFIFLTHKDAASTVDARMRGVQDFLSHVPTDTKAAGEDVEATFDVLRVESSDLEHVQNILPDELPDAFLAKDDSLAAALLRTLYRRDVRVPEQVRVAGFDDSPIAAELTVPLTSVRQPVPELADAAMYLMETRELKPSRPARRIVIGGQLVVRESA